MFLGIIAVYVFFLILLLRELMRTRREIRAEYGLSSTDYLPWCI